MATKKPAEPETKNPPVAILVSARREGFRRCGLSFGKNPTEVTVSPEDAEILQAEPMLTVSVAAEAE